MVVSKRLVLVGWVCLLGSSIGELAQLLVTPVPAAQGTAAAQIAGVDGHGGAMRLGTWLDLAILLIVPAVLFAGHVAGGRASRLATAGAGITFFGTLGAGYLLAFDPLVRAAAGVADRPAAAAVVAAYEQDPVVVAVTVAALGAEVVGFALLGAALIRGRAVPWWAGVALIVCMPLEVAGSAAGSTAVAAAGGGLKVLAFVTCAVALTRAARTAAPVDPDTGPAAVRPALRAPLPSWTRS